MSHVGNVRVSFANSANVFSFCFPDKETNDKFLEKKKFLDLSDSIHCGIKTHMHTENFENSELVKIVNCKFRKVTS